MKKMAFVILTVWVISVSFLTNISISSTVTHETDTPEEQYMIVMEKLPTGELMVMASSGELYTTKWSRAYFDMEAAEVGDAVKVYLYTQYDINGAVIYSVKLLE